MRRPAPAVAPRADRVSTAPRTIVIAGATGLVAAPVLEHFASPPGWDVPAERLLPV